MSDERRAFVEDYGVMFEQMGSTRMLGRVWGALMVADPPEMTAEELADFLKASRGSISQATRQLIEIGVVRRINKPGIRRDYYRVTNDSWGQAFSVEVRSVGRMREVFRQGLAAMEDASPEAQASLRDAIAFCDFWQTEITGVLERWKAFKEQSRD